MILSSLFVPFLSIQLYWFMHTLPYSHTYEACYYYCYSPKANVLMKDVDEITLGMCGPADSLLISANSGDPVLLDEQSQAIQSLASSLKTIAEDAVEGSVRE